MIQCLRSINNPILYKLAINFPFQGKLPFLSVMINKYNSRFSTTAYHKPTDNGLCLNVNSECGENISLVLLATILTEHIKSQKKLEGFSQ